MNKNFTRLLSHKKILTFFLAIMALAISKNTPHQYTAVARAADVRLSKEAFAQLSSYKYFSMGPESAKVTVYEFASLTCPHCAKFQTSVFPKIKEKYIATGKIKWQMVDFPLDNVAYGAAVLTRCVNDAPRYHNLIDELYKTQDKWLSSPDPKKSVLNVMAQAGVENEVANKCLKEKKYLDAVSKARKLGENIGVNATPSFFVMDEPVPNDEKALTAAIEKAIKKP